MFIQTFPNAGKEEVTVKVPPDAAFTVKFCVLDAAAAPVVVTPTGMIAAADKSVEGMAAVN